MTTTDWYRLYKEGWQGEIVPEAFAHPAKYSRALIRHIYQHMIDEDWVAAGDSICDPFGGVALGGLDAMRHGLHWYGCELEEKFVDLGNRNIEKWSAKYAGHFPGWGSATLLHGDSRELSAVLNKRLGANEFEAAVSSPPYSESMNHAGGIDPEKSDHIGGPHSQMNNSDTRYGASVGQLGAMKAEGFEAAVSSPPFEGVIPQQDRTFTMPHDTTGRINVDYGNTHGQIGAQSGDDFWTAARAIVEQVHTVLKPGGHAVWVVKSFVKNKQIVDFPGQWQQLCEAVGFETLHYHRAWLVENRGAQYGLFGGELHEKIVERKSFFRRLSEKRGSPRIDYEVVLCMEKPKGDE